MIFSFRRPPTNSFLSFPRFIIYIINKLSFINKLLCLLSFLCEEMRPGAITWYHCAASYKTNSIERVIGQTSSRKWPTTLKIALVDFHPWKLQRVITQFTWKSVYADGFPLPFISFWICFYNLLLSNGGLINFIVIDMAIYPYKWINTNIYWYW